MAAAPVFGDKVVVVTGASAGIGRAFCLALAPQRPRLVLAAREAARLEAVASACREAGAQALVVPTDVASAQACRALVEQALARFGAIDVLVNNAGYSMRSRLEDVSDLSLYERMMQVNYLGAVYLTYHALPALKRARGRILVVSSLTGLSGVPTRTGYAASKHALIGFFDSLRIELQGSGVSVSVLCPDFVESEVHLRAVGPDGKALGKRGLPPANAITAEACAALMVRALTRRQRLVVTSLRGRLGRWLKLLAPALVDRIAARAVAGAPAPAPFRS